MSTAPNPNVRETVPDGDAERRDRDEQLVIQWMPLVVPLLAILIAVAVHVIDAAVL